MKGFLAALRLVQPFDWMHWGAPNLLDVDMKQLDINDCVRYITRHIRGERLFENFIGPWISSGTFGDLCEVAMRKANGQKAPLLPDRLGVKASDRPHVAMPALKSDIA